MKYSNKHRIATAIFLGVLLIVVLVFIPRGIDALFGNEEPTNMSLQFLSADDVLQYAGSVICGLLGLAAVIVAVYQFRCVNEVVIVPRNARFDYYPEHKKIEQYSMEGTPIHNSVLGITLDNVTENTALSYSFKVDFGDGKWVNDYIVSITGESANCSSDAYKTKTYVNRGVFSAKSTAIVSFDELYMLKRALTDISEELCCAQGSGARRYCPYENKHYKLMELTITTKNRFNHATSNTFEMNAIFYVIGVAIRKTAIILEFTQITKE